MEKAANNEYDQNNSFNVILALLLPSRKKYYVFLESFVKDVQVRLSAKTNRTLEHYFIHKKPPREMLTKLKHVV
jgi:hypothetical protein